MMSHNVTCSSDFLASRQVHVSHGNFHVLTGILSIYALQRALSGWCFFFLWAMEVEVIGSDKEHPRIG